MNLFNLANTHLPDTLDSALESYSREGIANILAYRLDMQFCEAGLNDAQLPQQHITPCIIA